MSRVNKLRDDLAKINFTFEVSEFFQILKCEICGFEKRVPLGSITSPVRYAVYQHSQIHGKGVPNAKR